MGSLALAQARATSVPPAKARLQSLCSWRAENSSQGTESVNEVSVCPTRRRPTSDPGESGQENRRDRWSQIRPARWKICPGLDHSPEPDEQKETQAAQAFLDTQARK